MTTISRAETGYNERDFRIGVALGLEMTKEEAAAFAGVDRSTVYSRLGTNKDFIGFVASTVKAAAASSIATTTAQIKKKYEAMYEKAVGVVEKTIGAFDDDPRLAYTAADKWIDRNDGRPTQRIEQKTESSHVERLEVVGFPADVLRYIVGAVSGTSKLLTGGIPPEEIPEAEIVRDENEPGSSPAEGSPASS